MNHKQIVLTLFVLLSPCWTAAEVELPVGNAPEAIAFEHFPSRLHAFVWRNWPLVEAERLARVLQTEPEKVRMLAESMGLPPQHPIAPKNRERIYITLIRRNWHLLPYEQLLELLEFTPERLANSLREDDFLFVKLGSLKPKCEPLVYHEPTEAEQKRCNEIRAIVRSPDLPEEERFHFLEEWSQSEPSDAPRSDAGSKRFSPRFLYSYCSLYGDPLMNPDLDSHPEGLLRRLSELGVDGVWIHTVLRDLAPGDLFADPEGNHKIRLQTLAALVQRAKKYGIGIYLYMNEPRAMPEGYFAGREQPRGTREGDYCALCTSSPEVKQWLSDSLAMVFERVPDLAGVFTISASENLTHCASHGNAAGCPRCRDRRPAEIVAEVNAIVEEGVHRGNPDAKVIVWDWGWNDSWAEEAIRLLPKSVWFQSVSEWSKPITRGGIETEVGEYSISAVGPGPRAMRHWKAAKEAGLKTVAKVAFNNTWELSAVPYLPVMDLIAEHCSRLREQDVDGLMLSWTLGGCPSPNLALVREFESTPPPTAEEALQRLAERDFGSEGAPYAREAWKAFSRAFAEYPYHGSVVYQCPVQYGPSNLLYPKPTGYAATMVGLPYDDVNGWRGPYPAEVFARQFETMARMWKEGLAPLRTAVQRAPAERREVAAQQELIALAAHLHLASVANQVRFTLLRNRLLDPSAEIAPPEAKENRADIEAILRDEIQAGLDLFQLARMDSKIGFEASNHYFYVPHDLIEKAMNCQYILDRVEELYPVLRTR